LNNYDVIIIGAGASGLMCAATAGKRNRKVLVLDKGKRPGRKIIVSGGGKCNFTNLYVEAGCYVSANPHFCKSALKRYTQHDFIGLIKQYNIPFEEREEGQLFCMNSSEDILKMLLAECEGAGVKIITSCEVKSVKAENNEAGPTRFTIITDKGEFKAASLVVATGGLSIPNLGATGLGYEIARQFGISVLPTRAGLVPFRVTGKYSGMFERLSGITIDATLSTSKKTFRGNVLFTHRGISGPATLQLSNYWNSGETITINLLPDMDIYAWFREEKLNHPKALLRNLLSQHLPKNLVHELQGLFWHGLAEKHITDIPDKELKRVADTLTCWEIKPSDTEGFRTAEVTIGGVDTNELSSKTMETKKQPGLYFIGEVVDVTGHLGGFNLQWAWSSGHAAGEAV
jgi:predicted Rossmann fold flavoprotein